MEILRAGEEEKFAQKGGGGATYTNGRRDKGDR